MANDQALPGIHLVEDGQAPGSSTGSNLQFQPPPTTYEDSDSEEPEPSGNDQDLSVHDEADESPSGEALEKDGNAAKGKGQLDPIVVIEDFEQVQAEYLKKLAEKKKKKVQQPKLKPRPRLVLVPIGQKKKSVGPKLVPLPRLAPMPGLVPNPFLERKDSSLVPVPIGPKKRRRVIESGSESDEADKGPKKGTKAKKNTKDSTEKATAKKAQPKPKRMRKESGSERGDQGRKPPKKTVRKDEKIKCPHCPVTFEKRRTDNLSRHVREQHPGLVIGELSFRCPKCPSIRCSVRDLKDNMKSHEEFAKLYICRYCQKTYNERQSYNSHEKKCPRNPANM